MQVLIMLTIARRRKLQYVAFGRFVEYGNTLIQDQYCSPANLSKARMC